MDIKQTNTYKLGPPHLNFLEQKGLISIIIPIYATEMYLRECLDSVLAQTVIKWEAILVNDGSPDNSSEIINEYAAKDKRFIAIHHQQNKGLLLARKTGLEHTKGEFIANLDSDDVYHPQFLEKMYAKIKQVNADFVWCKSQYNDQNERFFIAGTNDFNFDSVKFIKTKGWYFTWNKLIKRSIYAKIVFPEKHFVSYEDFTQLIQIAYHSKSAVFISENLYYHRPNTGNTYTRNCNARVICEEAVKYAVVMHNIAIYLGDHIPYEYMREFYSGANACHYFSLQKKERESMKNEFEPLLPQIIKYQKAGLKICLFLASKGIEFPFRVREYIKKRFKK